MGGGVSNRRLPMSKDIALETKAELFKALNNFAYRKFNII